MLFVEIENAMPPKGEQLAQARKPFLSYIVKAILVAPLLLLISFHLIFFISEKIHREGQGLIGHYYQGTDFSKFLFRRSDDKIYFDSNSFPKNVPQDNFSVQWKGQVFAPTEGTYTFATRSDDGVRLWIDNKLLIDDWRMHGETMNKNEIYLSKGWHPLSLNYFQSISEKSIKLFWSAPGDIIKPVASRYLRPDPTRDNNR